VTARRVTVLGATGSVGRATLDLIRRADPGVYDVVALTANRDIDGLVELAREFRPHMAALGDQSLAGELADRLSGTEIATGAGEAAVEAAAAIETDWTMAAIVGAAGLRSALIALRHGACVAFANKEALVCSGELFLEEARKHGATLLPVDSEHNAVFQSLAGAPNSQIRRIVLTASGGPFRTASLEMMRAARPEDALKHPTWTMGAKITIDSATMMNKGLEIIEACHLFGLPQSRVDVLVHPGSIVHGMVEYLDGGWLAQMGSPDMRTPIAHALAWPGRIETPVERLDLAQLGQLVFEAPDPDRFPSLDLARQAFEGGGGQAAVLNAANEVAVEAFLNRRIGFLDIVTVVSEALEDGVRRGFATAAPDSVEAVFEIDAAARESAQAHASRRAA